MKVAAIQAAPVFLDAAATTDKALGLLREAAGAGAELCAFPEVYISGYPAWLRAPAVATDDDLLKLGLVAYLRGAVAAEGPELAAITGEAAKLVVFVYMGFLERTRRPVQKQPPLLQRQAAVHQQAFAFAQRSSQVVDLPLIRPAGAGRQASLIVHKPVQEILD